MRHDRPAGRPTGAPRRAFAARAGCVVVAAVLLACVPIVASYEGLRCDDEAAPCGEGFACVDGTCHEQRPTPGPLGCAGNADCAQGVCDAKAGYCVGCLDDEDCTAGAHCLRAQRYCVQCTSDAHCPDGTLCDLGLHVCKGTPPPEGPL